MRTRLVPIAWILMLMLAASACGGADNQPDASAAPAPPPSGPVNLKGVCPDPVVVQTNWFPQSEHGAVYQLVGQGATIDANHKPVTGPLVVDGKSTGVRIEIRAGRPGRPGGPGRQRRPHPGRAPRLVPPRGPPPVRRRPTPSSPAPPGWLDHLTADRFLSPTQFTQRYLRVFPRGSIITLYRARALCWDAPRGCGPEPNPLPSYSRLE